MSCKAVIVKAEEVLVVADILFHVADNESFLCPEARRSYVCRTY